jgi:FtsZ-binding cell division protein ZapB
MSEEPIKAYIGNYEIGTTDLLIPAEALRRANDEIDRERTRRRLAAEEAQAAAKREAYAKSWRGRLRALFGRKGR